MSGSIVVTPNSIQGRLNQTPNPLFIEKGISDPIVQQNFQVLNKTLQKRLQGVDVPKANIVFSPAFASGGIATTFTGSTDTQTPGTLQVQITTRGNPVKIKLAPFLAADPSYLKLSAAAQNSVAMVGGWKRIASLGANTIISQAQIGSEINPPSSGVLDSIFVSIPLPAFEFEDVVPSGTYTYQFFFRLGDATTTLSGLNLNLVAMELR